MKKKYLVNNHEYIFDGNNLVLYLKHEDIKKQSSKVNYVNQKTNSNKKLFKLVFNVSNTCNLNCKYCYASGGNYNRKDSLMKKETIDKILTEIYVKYDYIKTIYFFGGEPLINFDSIKYIVDKLNEHYQDNNFDYRIVTNGIFLSKSIIEFFDKNKFKVYVSIDGPKKIQEFLRGTNTFNVVMNNINLLKSAKNIKVQLLCTYTKYHQDNISFNDLISFFEKTGFNYSINDVDTNDNTLKLIQGKDLLTKEKEFIDISIDRIVSNSKNLGVSNYLTSVINALLYHKKQEYFCKELSNDYSNVYDYNGDTYNCIRLLGYLKKDDPLVKKANTKCHNLCKNCWCKNLCSLCLAEILLKTNTFPFYNNSCNNMELYDYALEKIIYMLEYNKDELQNLLNNYLNNFIK